MLRSGQRGESKGSDASRGGQREGQVAAGDIHQNHVVFQLSGNEPTDEESWEREVRLQARFAKATGIHAGPAARSGLEKLLKSGVTVAELRPLWRADLLRWDDTHRCLKLDLPRSDFWQGLVMLIAALLYLITTLLATPSLAQVKSACSKPWSAPP